MRKNILITGVHGYIGNALKDKLTSRWIESRDSQIKSPKKIPK